MIQNCIETVRCVCSSWARDSLKRKLLVYSELSIELLAVVRTTKADLTSVEDHLLKV